MNLCFWGGASLHNLWNLSFPTRDQTQAPAVKAPSCNHWTTREFPKHFKVCDSVALGTFTVFCKHYLHQIA